MSSLDESFIRAYAKKPLRRASGSQVATPAAGNAEDVLTPQTILVVPPGVEMPWYGDAPAKPTNVEAILVDQPPVLINQPAVSIIQPVLSVEERAVSVDQQAISIDQPAVSIDQPTVLIDQPARRRVPAPHARHFGTSPQQNREPSSGEGTVMPHRSQRTPASRPVAQRVPLPDKVANVATEQPPRQPQARGPSMVTESRFAGASPAGLCVQQFVLPELCHWLLRAAEPMFRRLALDLVTGIRRQRKTWLVTSPRRGAGRTTLTLCLAELMARQSANVLAIDGDFGNPRLAARLGVTAESAAPSTATAGAATSGVLIRSAAQPRLALLPLASHAEDLNPSWDHLGGSPDQDELGRQFDLILIDGSPLCDEPLASCADGELAGLVDAALLVRHVGQTSAEELIRAQRHLERVGIGYGGIAENFVSSG